MEYDPTNPLMAKLVDAIWRGEGRAGPDQGFDYTNLSNAPRGTYGFPIWAGIHTRFGWTHAAGRMQFEPGTWNWIASQHSLDFRKPEHQDAGAWYLAESRVPDLYARLQAGLWGTVGADLLRTWPGGAKAVMRVT